MHTQKTKYIWKIFLLFSIFVIVIYSVQEGKTFSHYNENPMLEEKVNIWHVTSPLEKYLQLSDGQVSFSKLMISLFDEITPLYNYSKNYAMSEYSLLEREQMAIYEGMEKDNDNTYSLDFLVQEQNQKDTSNDFESYDIEHVEFTDFTNELAEENSNNISEILLPVNSTNVQVNKDFISKKNKVLEYDLTKMKDKDYLIQNFYVVDSGTTAPVSMLDIETLLGKDMTIDRLVDGPQILIYHTHSQEGYADSVAGDTDTTIVGMGELLKNILEEKYGYRVLHHTGKYDEIRHDYAYSYALPEISKILEENPSIQVVIDLHRDEVAPDKKLVVNQDGRETAQFMFFNGVSFVNGKGQLESLQNPNLQSNLAFSFQMQKVAGEYYPGLARRIYLKGYRYNMHLSDKYLLVELGAQTNTVEEAKNACYPLADVLDKVIGKK